MSTILTLEEACARVSVSPSSGDAVDVQRLLDAVEREVKRLSQRGFEGVPTVYSEVLEVYEGRCDLTWTPVTDVLSVAAVDWDGREIDGIYVPTQVTGGLGTTLAAAALAGATNVKTAAVDIGVGDHLSLGSGTTQEVVRITAVGTAGSGGTGLTFEPALRWDKASGALAVEVTGSSEWSLWSAARGRLRLATTSDRRNRRVRVVYRVSGDVPHEVKVGALEWIHARWGARRVPAGQSSYRTGQDSENWDPSRVGLPPNETVKALIGHWRPSGSGVI